MDLINDEIKDSEMTAAQIAQLARLTAVKEQHEMIERIGDDVDNSVEKLIKPNQLIIRLQPDEGMLVKFNLKKPAEKSIIINKNLEFHYKKLGDDVLRLNTRGKTNRFIGGALGGGVGEATFVGDVEKIGTFGDLIGGPTEVDRESDGDPVKDLINRVKFGTEGALFTGLIGGVGSTIKQLSKRGKELRFSNNKIDRVLDKVAAKFRARGGKTQEFFDQYVLYRDFGSPDKEEIKKSSTNHNHNIK